MATITFNGDLILDQTTGIQGDDADLVVSATNPGIDDLVNNGVDTDGGRQIASAFLQYVNGLTAGLTDPRMDYAAKVEGAVQDGMINVTKGASETITRLFFTDALGNDLNAVATTAQTLSGAAVYLHTAAGTNGKIALATDSASAGGNIVAAFYLDANSDNTSAGVQAITFMALKHPNAADPNDRVDFADFLKVSAVVTTSVPVGVDDDGPTIITSGAAEPTPTVDETVLTTDATGDFSGNFTPDFGTDGAGTLVYTLDPKNAGAVSGLVDTATGENVVLSKNGTTGDVEGRTVNSNDLVFKLSIDGATGIVTLDQLRAVLHSPDSGPDQSTTLAADDLVKLTATITDADGDTAQAFLLIGQNLVFEDDAPAKPTVSLNATVSVDESAGLNTAGDPNPANDVAAASLPSGIAAKFNAVSSSAIGYAQSSGALVTIPAGGFGADGPASGGNSVTYALSASSVGAPSGMSTATGTQIFLYNGAGGTALEGLVLGRVGVEAGAVDTADPSGAVAFALAIDGAGLGYIAEFVALKHDTAGATAAAYDDVKSITDGAVQVTVTRTDRDGDSTASDATNVGGQFRFQDDGPTIVTPFDPDGAGSDTVERLGNAIGQTAAGAFGYDLGTDGHDTAFYGPPTSGSDFVDADGGTTGVQLNLAGTVGSALSPITQAVVTRTAESDTSASFAFSFHYDSDPITGGVQDATAAGTLVFNKAQDTYTLTLTDQIDGFSFDVLHTSELVAKAPAGNTGHPLIVATQLTPNNDPSPFFVQFTANSNSSQVAFGFNGTGDGNPIAGDVTYNNGQFVTSSIEDWVSATQSTNGVAGDTIQKGELLTLRFFNTNILGDVNPGAPDGGTERIDPTAKAAGVVVKFDGIGNSEDLMVILDLKDAGGNETTRAVYVQNSDLIKGNANIPFPYSGEFSLDNNDALLIIEASDYNASGETYQIQGMQIMQSANDLIGGLTAINLNPLTGASGGSSATSSLVPWDPSDQDVLKIVDIGFVQNTSGTLDASLDFSFQLVDGDGDTTLTQHILVNISNDWIV